MERIINPHLLSKQTSLLRLASSGSSTFSSLFHRRILRARTRAPSLVASVSSSSHRCKQCSHHNHHHSNHHHELPSSKNAGSTNLTNLVFWSSKSTWSRASINTLRCLFGCTLGDFSALWYLQSSYPTLGMGTTMLASMASGLLTSITLETLFLRYGKDRLAFLEALKTALGMSLVSMLAMESVSNAVDWHLTGGAVSLGDPLFWGAAAIATGAGFLAPLPYNYVRLKKYGVACH